MLGALFYLFLGLYYVKKILHHLATALGLVYLTYTIRFTRILRAIPEAESRMVARDLLKISVLYLPLLFTTLMVLAPGWRCTFRMTAGVWSIHAA